MQPLFQRGSPFTRLLFFIAISVALMVADHRYHHVDQVRVLLASTIAPLRYAVDLPSEAFEWASARIASRTDLVDEIDRLEHVNLRLRARQQRFETLRSENERLRVLLDSSAERQDRVLISELLSVDLDPYRQQVVINHGAQAGAYVGQPVIDAHGVMGQLIQVGPITSTVLLISDPNHAMPVQINRNGLRTIAEGTGETHRLELLYIPNSADVRIGDLVVTSGLGGVFPRNYPVATVVVVERRPGEPFAHVEAQPEAHLARSREVLLVWPDNAESSPTVASRQTSTATDDGDANTHTSAVGIPR